jgi:hypothetical protein
MKRLVEIHDPVVEESRLVQQAQMSPTKLSDVPGTERLREAARASAGRDGRNALSQELTVGSPFTLTTASAAK